MINRRNLLIRGAALAALSPLNSFTKSSKPTLKKKLNIGACDWSIGKNSDIEAFDVAKQIGLKGIMVDMGGEKNNLHLREKAVQKSYLEASKRTGVKISSVAMGVLNSIPYKSDPRTEQWVLDSIDTAKNLGAPVILLAFFSNNDLRNDEAGKKEVIRRLKAAAPKAEKSGVILGIESYLNAAEHLEILHAVGSKNVKVYYDFRNTADAGHDTVEEFKKIGPENICELHIKENGFLLGEGTLDWKKISDAIYETGYYGDGWMQIEGALPKDADLITGYKHNLALLQSLFEKEI